MACFLVPAAEAVITTVAAKVIKSKEKEPEIVKVHLDSTNLDIAEKTPFSGKIKWLSNLLWGGSALLAFEHVWHGEVVPWFPFLTAASNPADAVEMLHEMSTVGTTMAILITVVWFGMLATASAIEKKAVKSQTTKEGA
ncbi:MAG: hypothetical protein NC318_06990 [Blautia sp.]|nr:hypothetical protein [Lachnoclostridium sp.]MCM1211331.1 hypothetical protein [Blautia sp.]